jgi:hypothetical protein
MAGSDGASLLLFSPDTEVHSPKRNGSPASRLPDMPMFLDVLDAVCSADRDAVLQAALGPERVLAALDLQARALADVLLERLAVVAHVLDDPDGPIVRRPML